MSAPLRNQLELDFARANQALPGSQETSYSTGAGQTGVAPLADAAPASLKTPSFDGYIHATAARRAGRINAASVSEKEHMALLAERQCLLDKKFDGTMTRPEMLRLEYVRWSLDRIEDAKHGEGIDKLEDAVSQYEHLLRDLEKLRHQLAELNR